MEDKYSVVIRHLNKGKFEERVIRKHLTQMGAKRVWNATHKKDPLCAVFIRKEDEV